MKRKKFYLTPYQYFFECWRLYAAVLFVGALALLLWSPPELKLYRTMLLLSAGLGALVFVIGFALYRLSFVAIGDTGVAVQLPLWRVRFPYTTIKLTRPTTLSELPTGKWEPDLAERSAVVVELTQWPQPRPVMRFWLGKLVLANAIVLPVDDVIAFNRALDVGLSRLREARLDALRHPA